MINWQAAYNGLSSAGYTDDQIADVAGVSRSVINRVRNGTYTHDHEPRYSSGVKVLGLITDALAHGYLLEDPLEGKR